MSSPRFSPAMACIAISSWSLQSQRREPSTSPVEHCEWMRTKGASPRRSPSDIAIAVSTRPDPFPVSRSNPRARNTPQRVGMRVEATRRSVSVAMVEGEGFMEGFLLGLSFLGSGSVLFEERREDRLDFGRAHPRRKLRDLGSEGLLHRLACNALHEAPAGLQRAGRLLRQP